MNRPNFIRAKDNPFTVQRVTAVPYKFQSGDWESNLDGLSELGFRAAIVGPQGTGKSSLLRDLAEQLNQRGYHTNYVFLPRDRNLHRQLLQSTQSSAAKQITLLDGVERLSFLQRLSLIRRLSRLVITAHTRRVFPFRLPTWIATNSRAETVEYILDQIGMQDPQVLGIAKQLLDVHDGNVRLVLRDLYDRFTDFQLTCPRSGDWRYQ